VQGLSVQGSSAPGFSVQGSSKIKCVPMSRSVKTKIVPVKKCHLWPVHSVFRVMSTQKRNFLSYKSSGIRDFHVCTCTCVYVYVCGTDAHQGTLT